MKKKIISDDLYKVDITLTLFFNQIFGENELSDFKENATLKDYKSNFCKLIITIKKAFANTVSYTDLPHKKQVNNLIDKEKKNIQKCSSIENIYKSLIMFYPKLCFLILGEIPMNSNKRRVSNWSLNNFRQIEYKQNRKQKNDLLSYLLKSDLIENIEPYKVLIEKYSENHDLNESFFDWFIRNYPIHYIRIFDL